MPCWMKTPWHMQLLSDQVDLIPKKTEKKFRLKRPITFSMRIILRHCTKKLLNATNMRPETRQSMEMLFAPDGIYPRQQRIAI